MPKEIRKKIEKILTGLVVLSIVFSGIFNGEARAEFNSTKETGWPTFNDSIRTIIPVSDGSFYVGGNFTTATEAADATLPVHFAGFNTTTGVSTLLTSEHVSGQAVDVVISDGGTGWYIGGNFTSIGGESLSRVAHILSDGSVDTAFAVDVNDRVFALALSPDHSVLYLGGDFTDVNGEVRQYAAAVYTTDGSIHSFDPGLDVTVDAIAISNDGLTVYLGGLFTSLGYGDENINALGVFNATTGAWTGLDVGFGAGSEVYTLLLNGGTLYVGGQFVSVNESMVPVDRNAIAAFSVADGSVLPFDPFGLTVGSPIVNTIALYNSTLYFGGNFAQINDDESVRNNVAGVDATTGAPVAFNPDVDGPVSSIAIASDGSLVYLGGQFTSVNQSTSPVTRNYIASFSSTTSTVTAFNPDLENTVSSVVLSGDDARIYAGGTFQDGLPAAQNVGHVVRVLADKTIDSSFNPDLNGNVYDLALSSDESILYAGGVFTQVNDGDASRNRLAAFTTSDGVVTAFNAAIVGSVSVNALELSSNDATLYAGGTFTSVNGGTTRNKVAAFTTSDGVVTAFDPNVVAPGIVYSMVLTGDDSTIYIGGGFNQLKGGAENRKDIAALSTADEGTVTAFNANIVSPPETVYALALSSDDSRLYATGQFSLDEENPSTNSSLGAFDAATGGVSSFNPTLNDIGYALALTSDDADLYVGGEFTQIDGVTNRAYGANFDTSDDSLGTFNADSGDTGFGNFVRTMAVSSDGLKLYAGGDFTGKLAVFAILSDTTAPSITVLGNNPHTLTVNTSYTDAGATATDDTDGTLTGSIITTGSVNTAVVGTYTITYTVTDAANNTATATRTVVVAPAPSSGGGGSSFAPILRATPLPSATPSPSATSITPAQYGLTEGDTISSPNSADPDIYIVNEFGYKRLFLNPIIFSFYGHLRFNGVKTVTSQTRNAFVTSSLFRNCEAKDPKVYGFVATGEDTGELRWVDTSGTQAVHDDPAFFQKVFCINNKEFTWYPKSATPFTSVTQIPVYGR